MKQDNKPTVSVIIAVYNGEKTIKRAIDSIFKQSWLVDEIIIVDDGSTDNTQNIVAEFQGKVLYNYQQNAGVSTARNKGVEQATSEWICFLDADDWYYPDRIKWHMEMIMENPALDFLTGDFDYINEKGEIIRSSMQSSNAGKKILSIVEEKVEEKAEEKSNNFVMQGELIGDFIAQHFGDTHTLTVKKETFIKLGGYPMGVAVCEDIHFLIRLCADSKKIGVITRPMAAYFIHQESATRSNPLRAQQQSVDSLNSLKSYMKSKNSILFPGLIRAIRHARLDLAYTLVKMGNRLASIKAVLPLLVETPGLRSVRDVLSIAKG